jgi:hypothetical protein
MTTEAPALEADIYDAIAALLALPST